MRAVQLLLNSYLPEDLRDDDRELNANAIADLLTEVGQKYPDRYEEISKK